MSGHRATKSGFAREAQEKVNVKYDEEEACKVLQWVQQNSGESFCTDGTMDNLYDVLNDGYILACLASKLGSKKISPKDTSKRQTMAFKKMELIGKFTAAAAEFGVSDSELFSTVDLSDRSNLHQVVICLGALGRKLGTFGPKEATKNERQFSKEQLDAGKNVISLQYGTNKGASQAGQNFGRQRHIVE